MTSFDEVMGLLDAFEKIQIKSIGTPRKYLNTGAPLPLLRE